MFIYNLYTRYIIDFIDVAESFFDQTNEKIVQTENEMVQLKSNKIQCSEPIPCKNANELHRISKRTPLNTRSKSCNTDLSFKPSDDIVFSIQREQVFHPLSNILTKQRKYKTNLI